MRLKNTLWKLSGDDWAIIEGCSPVRKNIFAGIGFFVALIFVLCFLSSFYTFVSLFQSYWIGIPAGLFFALMTTNIYLLLLYTLSKNVIPRVERSASRIISVAVRIGFIVFIAIVVAKPLEAYLFSDVVASEIEQFKKLQLEHYREVSDEDLRLETELLQDAIDKDLKLSGGEVTPSIASERKLIERHAAEQIRSQQRMEVLVAQSNYFVRSIALLNTQHPFCWFLTLLVAIVFAAPAILKVRTPQTSRFYEWKKFLETGLIEREYQIAKLRYAELFQDLHNENLELVELYEDSPYNTRPKTDKRIFLSQEVLVREIYDA